MFKYPEIHKNFRSQFNFNPKLIHLNNAGIAPTSRPAQDAIARITHFLAENGSHNLEPLFIEYDQTTRKIYADLLKTQPENVAMFSTCAAAITQMASGIPLQPEDEILTWAQEYPSNAYPWLVAAKNSRATVVSLPANSDGLIETNKLITAIHKKTKIVAISWVQFQTGAITDLQQISKKCAETGTWLVVDAIQGLGVIPFDFEKFGVDAVCGGTHKWLCGPLGHGFLAIKKSRLPEVKPILHGMYTYGTHENPVTDKSLPLKKDARKFEPGSPALLGAIGGAASIQMLLDFGIEKIHTTALELSDFLIQNLKQKNIKVLTQTHIPKDQRSPIVTFIPTDLKTTCEKLNQSKISYACRMGGVRVSPHAFNTLEEIELLLECV